MTSSELPATSMKRAMSDVVGRFGTAAETAPDKLQHNPWTQVPLKVGLHRLDSLIKDDSFGDLAFAVFPVFMEQFRAYKKEHKRWFSRDKESNGKKWDMLEARFKVAKHGLAVTALITEMAPLVWLKENPGDSISPEEAGALARNSYEETIGKIMLSGGYAGRRMAHQFFSPARGDQGGSIYSGVVINGQLANPDRLRWYQMGNNSNGKPAIVNTAEADDLIRGWLDEASSMPEDERMINCSAHIYENPITGATTGKDLLDIIAGHAERYIYPRYLPMAQRAIEHFQAESRLVKED